jgi:hypothetical protein
MQARGRAIALLHMTQLDMDKIARALAPNTEIAVSGGYFGAMELLADSEARFGELNAGLSRGFNPLISRSITEQGASPSLNSGAAT